MKKIFIFLSLFCVSIMARSQGIGLEDIIVEKYYVSDANDEMAEDGGPLPAGSITYRIFVDMAPGWKLQQVLADPDNGHALEISTTTSFFNNNDRGQKLATSISDSYLDDNTVMLDSWITMGGASAGKFGVLKADDTDGAIVNSDGFLQNEDARAGIPIKTKDGMIPMTPDVPMLIGLDAALSVFYDVNAGPKFYTDDGLWAVLSGVSGPTPENRVLIAQVTTSGTLSFKLNILIRRDSDLKIEKYVHSDPVGTEILCEKCKSDGVSVGINDALVISKDDYRIRLFPNPVDHYLNVDVGTSRYGSLYTLTIYNVIGNKLLNLRNINCREGKIRDIDISSLPKGIYIMRLSSDDGYFVSAAKFVKNT
jgi:hypothetical protein